MANNTTTHCLVAKNCKYIQLGGKTTSSTLVVNTSLAEQTKSGSSHFKFFCNTHHQGRSPLHLCCLDTSLSWCVVSQMAYVLEKWGYRCGRDSRSWEHQKLEWQSWLGSQLWLAVGMQLRERRKKASAQFSNLLHIQTLGTNSNSKQTVTRTSQWSASKYFSQHTRSCPFERWASH